MQRVLFIGGPGNISTTAIEQAAEHFGTAVFTLPESPADGLPPQVKLYRGDRNDAGALGAAVADFRPDVTVDTVCFTPEQARAMVRLLSGRVAQHIFLSTVDVYGYPLPPSQFRRTTSRVRRWVSMRWTRSPARRSSGAPRRPVFR